MSYNSYTVHKNRLLFFADDSLFYYENYFLF